MLIESVCIEFVGFGGIDCGDPFGRRKVDGLLCGELYHDARYAAVACAYFNEDMETENLLFFCVSGSLDFTSTKQPKIAP